MRGTGLDLSFALYTGDSDATARNLGEEPAESERLTRAAIRSQPPDILLTNYKQLEFLLVRREDRGLFTRSLRYLVLDEIHSYRGALANEIACPVCKRAAIRMFLHRGKLSTCPVCGDIYTRGDIVTPLRTGTASTVSVLTTHHFDRLAGEDRKLLVFADNRQDVAHQAGYTADKHRSFALRHAVARAVQEAGERGVNLEELPERLFDHYRGLGIIPRQPTGLERERWLDALSYEVANEFTRASRQRASLENLGLVAVDYEFLSELSEEPRFREAARAAGLEVPTARALDRPDHIRKGVCPTNSTGVRAATLKLS
ncbi:MAG: hypothetical protein ACUVYA_11765, partial [Planctomycetota bacterium]